jgi:hypothetical protein
MSRQLSCPRKTADNLQKWPKVTESDRTQQLCDRKRAVNAYNQDFLWLRFLFSHHTLQLSNLSRL